MSDTQIELPPRNYHPARRMPSRSFPSQVATGLLQPVYFFRTLPEMAETRQWLWAALIIILLIAFSTIRHQELADSGTEDPGIITPDMGMDPGMVGGPDMGGAPIDGGFGGPPDGGIPPAAGGATTDTNVTETWTTGVITGSGMLVQWALLTVLLALVTLFNGKFPRFGRNFQIAIWASLPLALMAVLQLLYFAAGGTPGKPGVSGVLDVWTGFREQSSTVQSLLLSATSLLTIFWLWSLMMIYYGARYALRGRAWASTLVVVIWMVMMVVLPVVTGAVKPPEAQSETEIIPGMEGEMPIDPSLSDPFASGGMEPSQTLEAGGELMPRPESSAEAEVQPEIQPEIQPEVEPTALPDVKREVKP